VLENIERPLDSYPKASDVARPAWLSKNLPGSLPWPHRWLSVAERTTARPGPGYASAGSGRWLENPLPGSTPVAAPLRA
jgi:hypothetical protein